jgi:hypothetical protein
MDYSVPYRQELLEQGIINRQFKQNPYLASSLSSSSDRNEPHFVLKASPISRYTAAREPDFTGHAIMGAAI